MLYVPTCAPPRSTQLTESAPTAVSLNQLWTRLPPQEVLQRLAQMIAQRLTLPDEHGEASDE
ncbi:hypothetical protein [Lignipirellula cremea]|uniref:hypothetical protein n=1 Tax=Lignipirellula cremea TaxID=2528010 RepID=UPI0011A3D9FE|nr:hypothetical protein [Lignipirellula cremea]